MALTIDLQLSAQAADGSYAKEKDETVYGTPEADRADSGNYMIIKKMDVDGQVVSDVTPSVVSGFLAVDEWQFDTAQDGWYQFTYLLILIWDVGQPYTKETVADINDESVVYLDSTSTFYRCIADDTGTTPDGNPLVWEPLDETTIEEVIDNTGTPAMITHVHNDLVATLHEKEFVREIEEAVDNNFCTDCIEPKQMEDYNILAVLLDGAYSNNEADRSSRMERIERFIEDKYIIS